MFLIVVKEKPTRWLSGGIDTDEPSLQAGQQ